VRGERDALGEGRGNGLAMRGNVPDMPAREPEVEDEGNEERRGKQRGKGGCGHEIAAWGKSPTRSVRE
jgi:hypothetical protein